MDNEIDLHINENDATMIRTFGALQKPPTEMMALLEWSEDKFWKLFDSDTSRLHELLKEGRIKFEYEVDMLLYEDFKNGNLKAFELLSKRISSRDED